MAAPLQHNVITTLLLLLLLGSGGSGAAQPRLQPGSSGNVSKHVAHFAHTLAPTPPPPCPAHTPMLLAAISFNLLKEETDFLLVYVKFCYLFVTRCCWFSWTVFLLQVVRHPLKVPSVSQSSITRARYGPGTAETHVSPRGACPGSSETSPLAPRKISAPSSGPPSQQSPQPQRRPSGGAQLVPGQPQRPSKLPVLPVYGHTGHTAGHSGHNPRAAAGRLSHYPLRKMTPPTSASAEYRLAGGGPALASKRPASPAPGRCPGTKRGGGGAGGGSPKRGDISRRVASPVFTARRRSPSLTRSVSPLEVSVSNIHSGSGAM